MPDFIQTNTVKNTVNDSKYFLVLCFKHFLIICLKYYIFFLLSCYLQPQVFTAHLRKTNKKDKFNELNQLMGRRGEKRWAERRTRGHFHGSIYHPWGHEPWHVTHARAHTHAPWWHLKQAGGGTAVCDRTHTSYSKRLALVGRGRCSPICTHIRAHAIWGKTLQHGVVTYCVWPSVDGWLKDGKRKKVEMYLFKFVLFILVLSN